MKLYTEEQVIQAFKSGMNACMKHKDWALAINYPNKIELLEYMQSLTPIEIPSDEEIIQWAKKQSEIEEIKLTPVLGSSMCEYTVIENKLKTIYENQEKILLAIKLLSRQNNEQ